MLPTRLGSNMQPPDHQMDAHPNEPPRPAQVDSNDIDQTANALSDLSFHWVYSTGTFSHGNDCSSFM